MSSINYCFTICRATDEKLQEETPSTPSSPETHFFGRAFAFTSLTELFTTAHDLPFIE